MTTLSAIDEDDEFSVDLAHAADEIGPDAGTKTGWGFRCLLVGYPVLPIRNPPQRQYPDLQVHRPAGHPSIMTMQLRRVMTEGALPKRAFKSTTDTTAPLRLIAANKTRHHWNRIDIAVFDDLFDPQNIDGEHLVVDQKCQVLGIATALVSGPLMAP